MSGHVSWYLSHPDSKAYPAVKDTYSTVKKRKNKNVLVMIKRELVAAYESLKVPQKDLEEKVD